LGDAILSHKKFVVQIFFSCIIRVMNTQHTPGPWTAKQQQPDGFGDPMFGRFYVCAGASAVAQHCRNEDDARLIAAAPDLLEALKDALCALECCGKDYLAASKAQAAIARATNA